MKLSDLVRLKNSLQNFSADDAKAALEVLDGQLNQLCNMPLHINYKESITENLLNLDGLEQNLNKIETKILALIETLEAEIKERTQEYLARGYIINGFYGSNATDVHTERNDRLLPITDETRSEIITRVRSYTDWRFPALEIGPGDGTWTEHLVAADPLYILDRQNEFLQSTLSKFNSVYRNRVRPYLTGIHANKQENDLSDLPKNQFGFIFSWNVFNYLPLKETKELLDQCMDCLRPGGTMMFSFNNCDVIQCAEYVEVGFRSWMPSQLLIDTCKQIGYEIITVRKIEETVHWIEIRKPGELKTVKGHQVLGRITQVTA
jgi:phospholipid N-methyltransferase